MEKKKEKQTPELIFQATNSRNVPQEDLRMAMEWKT